MSEAEHDPPIRNQLLEEAASWFARMRGPNAEESRAEFEAWLARGALHRSAYNRASEIFAMGKLLGEREEQPPPAGAAARPQAWSRFALLTVAAVALFLGTAWLALRDSSRSPPSNQQMAETGPRERTGSAVLATAAQSQTIRLLDGSLVRLGAGSRLEVAFDGRSRRLTLEQGAGRFEVAHETRPFIVHAGGGSVTARGTIFDVALSRDRRVSVRLIQGLVDVELPASTPVEDRQVRSRQLRPGQTLSFAGEQQGTMETSVYSSPAKQPAVTPQPATARDFDDVPLSEVVAEANSGPGPKIRLATPTIGEQRVSGRFTLNDTSLLAERLAALFELSVDRSWPGEIVLRRK